MENNLFAERIKELRINNKMTQQEFGNIFDVTSTGVSYWESGKALPSMDMVVKIANRFNVTTDYLIGNEELNPDNKGMLLFRKAETVDDTDKEKMYEIINGTIDAFLNSKDSNGSK